MAHKLSKDKTDNSEVDYEIGYGKPPADTRFVKGQSGNPHGRPKGKRNLATMLQAALNETVMITENGKRKQITKLEATFKQIVNKAASGDIASTKLLIQMFPWLETLLDEKATKSISNEADLEVMKHLQKRLLAEAGRNHTATTNDTVEAV
jgi:hypothetical protein